MKSDQTQPAAGSYPNLESTAISGVTDSPIETPTWPVDDPAVREVFAAMVMDGSWGRYHGPHCDRLIAAISDFHNVPHVVLCSSGTSAMELALRGLNVQPDDEVILCGYDFKANLMNVLTVGATPVLVDTFPGLPVMNPDNLAAAVSSRTRAVICSHLHGCLAPMEQILRFAESRGLKVIEDACQSPGALLDGRRVGSVGHAGILSFGGSKLLTAGRGGAVLTSDASVVQRIRLYVQRGNDAYPLSEMQAAVLLPQLHQLDHQNRTRLASVKRLLAQWPEGTLLRPIMNQASFSPDSTLPAFYKLAFRWDASVNREQSAATAARCREQKVPIDPALPALQETHSHRRFRPGGDLQHSTRLHHNLLTLHHPILLASDQTVDRAAVLLRSVFAENQPN